MSWRNLAAHPTREPLQPEWSRGHQSRAVRRDPTISGLPPDPILHSNMTDRALSVRHARNHLVNDVQPWR